MSYLLIAPSLKIYISGDSGYDDHFAETGHRFGPIDLAILENGQYNPIWKYVHMVPEEVLQAATDLKAKRLLPVHPSKFALSNHVWDDPLTVLQLNTSFQISLVMVMIREKVDLRNEKQPFKK